MKADTRTCLTCSRVVELDLPIEGSTLDNLGGDLLPGTEDVLFLAPHPLTDEGVQLGALLRGDGLRGVLPGLEGANEGGCGGRRDGAPVLHGHAEQWDGSILGTGEQRSNS